MEPIFICRFKQTKSILKEFFRYTFYKSRGVMLLYAVLIAGAVLVGITWKNTGKPGDGIVLIAGALLVQFFMYLKTASSTYERSKKSDGSDCTETVEFYEEKLVVKTDMGVCESYEYSSIKRLASSGGIILLKTSAGGYVVLDRNGFTGCSADEVIRFLGEKGIK